MGYACTWGMHVHGIRMYMGYAYLCDTQHMRLGYRAGFACSVAREW